MAGKTVCWDAVRIDGPNRKNSIDVLKHRKVYGRRVQEQLFLRLVVFGLPGLAARYPEKR